MGLDADDAETITKKERVTVRLLHAYVDAGGSVRLWVKVIGTLGVVFVCICVLRI